MSFHDLATAIVRVQATYLKSSYHTDPAPAVGLTKNNKNGSGAQRRSMDFRAPHSLFDRCHGSENYRKRHPGHPRAIPIKTRTAFLPTSLD